MQYVLLISCFIAGFALAYLYLNSRSSVSLKESQNRFIEAERNSSILSDRLQQIQILLKTSDDQLQAERIKSGNLNANLAEQRTIAAGLQEKLDTQKSDLEKMHQQFTLEFENLSAKILDEKSRKFTEQNRTNLDIILNPLKEKIKEFEQKVEQSYKLESTERNSLKGEIKSLIDLNKQISEEANNLTRALKGDTKKQGNWGEVILERILERSGLVKGSEYDLQYSTSNDEGRRIQPDVIVNLPDKKHIVIDSKVSLVAYEAMVNAKTDEDREKYLRDHVSSIRSHVRILSEKNYASSQEFHTPDFVLLFMPIEPSFATAVQEDTDLYNFAWERRIVLVSPTTLLATLTTVSSIWKQERQTKNAMEIARVGGALYDKFHNFIKDLNIVGDRIRSAQQSHDDAVSKLYTGSGNIIKRVEELKKLGAKTTKEIPQNLLESAEENDAESK